MRFLQIPKGVGIWSSLYLVLGIGLTFSATCFWLLNVLFSAFGIMQFTGADLRINTNDILFSFMPNIIDGGRVGLILSIMGGSVASIIEVIVWLSPQENKKRGTMTSIDKKDLFIWFSIVILIYDVLSSHYYLMGGTFIDFSHGITLAEKIINGLLSFVSVMGITIILFSIGSELFLVFGLELIVANWKDGYLNIKKMVYSIFNVGEDDEKEYHKDNFQRNENRNRPYEDLEKNRIQERFRELNRNDEFHNNGNTKQNNNHKRGRGRPPKEHPKEFQKNDLLTTIFGSETKENNFE